MPIISGEWIAPNHYAEIWFEHHKNSPCGDAAIYIFKRDYETLGSHKPEYSHRISAMGVNRDDVDRWANRAIIYWMALQDDPDLTIAKLDRQFAKSN